MVETNEGDEIFVGNVPGVAEGMYIQAEGEYVHHPQYDIQFKVITAELSMPSDIEGITRFLGSGIIKGMAAGSTTITATTSSGRTANVKVTVVGLNYESLTLEQYDTYRLQVIGTTSGIIWDVDNPNICTVRNGLVEGKRAGTTTVIARVNGAELRCRVTVVDMP